MIWTLLACWGAPETPEPTREHAADEVIFRTISDLGSFVLTSRLERTIAPAPTVVEEQEVRWEDPDMWSMKRSKDGKVIQQIIVAGGVPWLGVGELSPKEDPEPYRVILAESWDPWKLAMDPVQEQLRLVEDRKDVFEGRPVRVYQLAGPEPSASATDEKKPRKKPSRPVGWVVLGASGEVWLDEQTSVRLKADAMVTAKRGNMTQDLRLIFQVSNIGGDAEIPSPVQVTPSNIP